MEMEIDVEAMVMDKYPYINEETNCAMIKRLRNLARDDYRLKLLKQQRESKETATVQPGQCPQG